MVVRRSPSFFGMACFQLLSVSVWFFDCTRQVKGTPRKTKAIPYNRGSPSVWTELLSSSTKERSSLTLGWFGYTIQALLPRKLTCPFKKLWLEDYFPFWNGPFLGDMLFFGGSSQLYSKWLANPPFYKPFLMPFGREQPMMEHLLANAMGALENCSCHHQEWRIGVVSTLTGIPRHPLVTKELRSSNMNRWKLLWRNLCITCCAY